MTSDDPKTSPMPPEVAVRSFVMTSAAQIMTKRRTWVFSPLIALLCAVLAFAQLGYSRQAKTNGQKAPNGMQKAISAIRGAYAAFNRGDFEAAVSSLDPKIEWTEPAQFPGGGTYHGRNAVKGYLSQSQSGWTEGSSKPVRFIMAGNHIVVFVFVRFRPKGDNNWHEAKIADVYTVRQGRIVQMNAFADRDQALRWAGARKPQGVRRHVVLPAPA